MILFIYRFKEKISTTRHKYNHDKKKKNTKFAFLCLFVRCFKSICHSPTIYTIQTLSVFIYSDQPFNQTVFFNKPI